MNALKTCCGYYCASVALVGVYFFVIMAIMEFKGNTYLLQILQHQTCENWSSVSECCCHPDLPLTNGVCTTPESNCLKEHQAGYPEVIDPKTKGIAFLIVALVEVILIFGCYWCGADSMKKEADAAKKERDE